MSVWWEANASEKYWVEIRKAEGIGTSLSSPNLDVNGRRNGWYDLVRRVHAGDIVYHYNARESRFVGRSVAARNAIERKSVGEYAVPLRDFDPIVASVDLADIRAHASEIYDLRDMLVSRYGGPLYLPFQFTQKRSSLRMMSNYFAKAPRELVVILFGSDGMAETELPKLPPWPGEAPAAPGDAKISTGHTPGSFLEPFKPKADADYAVHISGGRRVRTRRHEKLVNDCASWLSRRGFETGRNAAIDLGTQDPRIVIEAKVIGASWPTSIREAIGQLYEYRYFRVADPGAGLIFLADKPVPARWIDYLERDRLIGAMWMSPTGFRASPLAKRLLHL